MITSSRLLPISLVEHLYKSVANLTAPWPGMPHKRYYAFVRGKHTGIFFDIWNNVQDFGKGTSRPLYRGSDSFEEAKKFMAENGLYINQVQPRCELTGNHLDQQVTSEPDAIITSNHNKNIQDCTLNSANDLDTEENMRKILTQLLALTFQLPPVISKTERSTTYWQDHLS